MPKASLPVALVLVIGLITSVRADEPASAGLKELNRFVGHWSSNMEARLPDGKAFTVKIDVTAKWVLEKTYLEQTAVDRSRILWTYDDRAKIYRVWSFTARSHQPRVWTATWDEETQTFHCESDMGKGFTFHVKYKFDSEDQYNIAVTVVNAEGKVSNHYNGTCTRKSPDDQTDESSQ